MYLGFSDFLSTQMDLGAQEPGKTHPGLTRASPGYACSVNVGRVGLGKAVLLHGGISRPLESTDPSIHLNS